MDIKNAILGCSKNVLFDEPMKNHTTFRIGGPADIFCEPQCEKELIDICNLFQREKTEYYVIGNGSNILVTDKGIRGAVIKIGKNMSDISADGEYITAQSGILLSRLAAFALANGLEGFENLSGIPGNLGGAIYMNAGAYGSEMSQITVEVRFLTDSGDIKTLKADELGFDYRKSRFTGTNDIILSCKLHLKKGSKTEIEEKMKALARQRSEKQPLNFPSAGSTFKRPEGYFAGKLIEDCGLKGYETGGAKISEKHAGFIINNNNANAEDVLKLIEYVQNKVMEKFGVMLQPEIKIIGER